MAYTTIDKPTDYFETVIWTGNGSGRDITVSHGTNWIWGKRRNGTNAHWLMDTVRGVDKRLISSGTDVEDDPSTAILTAFNSNGFSLGTNSECNLNGATYVGWSWKAGTSVSGTTTGSGTGKAYSGSVSTTAGFSIIKYLGNGTAGHTIPHHLGAVPEWILVKQTIGGDENWFSYHVGLGNTKDIHLNQANAGATADSWNDTTPTSSVFSISDQSAVNGNGNTHVAYCFAEKQGYSKFGSYVGNGNVEGPFVYTGFKPAFVLVKNGSSNATNWSIVDNKRDSSNDGTPKLLLPDSNSAESTFSFIDLLSNGFKLRYSSDSNTSGNVMIYMAFAENPFVTSTGIPTTAR